MAIACWSLFGGTPIVIAWKITLQAMILALYSPTQQHTLGPPDRVERFFSSIRRANLPMPLLNWLRFPHLHNSRRYEQVFSGMSGAITHNSDYQSAEECMLAIDRYFDERNENFRARPKRAGKKIWGKEIVDPSFRRGEQLQRSAMVSLK